MEESNPIRTVLIADNSRTARILIETALRSVLGRIFVLQAGGGLEAFETAQASPPDLLITPVRLSRMNGITLVKKVISTRKPGPPLRVILLTPFNRYSIRQQLGSAAKLGFADKPVLPEELKKALEEIRR